jgi:hypothetical protein
MGFGGRNIESGNTAACNAAHRENRVEQSRAMVVGRIAGSAGDLEDTVAAGQRLTHVGAVPDMRRRLCENDLRHG